MVSAVNIELFWLLKEVMVVTLYKLNYELEDKLNFLAVLPLEESFLPVLFADPGVLSSFIESVFLGETKLIPFFFDNFNFDINSSFFFYIS